MTSRGVDYQAFLSQPSSCQAHSPSPYTNLKLQEQNVHGLCISCHQYITVFPDVCYFLCRREGAQPSADELQETL